MPPRATRTPGGKATVNHNHPAATAAAAARLMGSKKSGGKPAAPPSRNSPPCTAKTLANDKIQEICHHTPSPAVASEAPDDAQATAGVTVDFAAIALALGGPRSTMTHNNQLIN